MKYSEEAHSSNLKKRKLLSDIMKKKIDKMIDKSLRFHHRDIHGELTDLKKDMKLRAQVKSKFYYIFWGVATIAVVLGQLYVGTGYRLMAKSILRITTSIEQVLSMPDSDDL